MIREIDAHGAAEAGRGYNTTDMSDSRLGQVYLPPYKASIEAGSATIMSAFNPLNGVPATCGPWMAGHNVPAHNRVGLQQ